MWTSSSPVDCNEVGVEGVARGFFTLSRLPAARDLWLLSTGTGLAPFISILRSREVLERFENVVLVHGTRWAKQLAYAEELRALSADTGGRIRYVPLVTREEPPDGVLHGRITKALATGELERAANLTIAPEHSHLMLCGNPEMIEELQRVGADRQLKKHRTREPGHITVERYW